MLSITVSNKIFIENAPEEVFQWCKEELEFPNPEYAKKQNMGLWTGNTDPQIVLWERKGRTAILPYGYLQQVLDRYPTADVSYVESSRYPKIDYGCNISLYDYQLEAVCSVLHRSGVLVMPCGSGKTQTALALASKYGLRTLWLTHTQELLNQSRDRALSCYNLTSKDIGTITGGKIDVGDTITFATVQTMSNIDLLPYLNHWDVIIVDECHKAVGTPTKLMMFYKVVSSLNAKIKLGLTATPKRNDGLEKCMYALLGPVLHQVPDSAVAQNTVPVQVYMAENHSYHPDILQVSNPDGTLNYTKVIQSLTECSDRNKDIARIVNDMNELGCTCLVLSDRVEHLRTLRDLVGEDYTMQIFSIGGSAKARQERKDCIQNLKDRKIRCLFATYQLAKEGLDIPSLNCVVFATPKKDQITVIQSAGRVGRKAEGKQVGIVIDIVDVDFPIFKGYAKKRKNFYKNKKFSVL